MIGFMYLALFEFMFFVLERWESVEIYGNFFFIYKMRKNNITVYKK